MGFPLQAIATHWRDARIGGMRITIDELFRTVNHGRLTLNA
jgi:hypothetical protein